MPPRNTSTNQGEGYVPPAPVHPQLAQIQRDVHDQLLNALAKGDDANIGRGNGEKDKEKNQRATGGYSTDSAEVVAQRLHDIVDVSLLGGRLLTQTDIEALGNVEASEV